MSITDEVARRRGNISEGGERIGRRYGRRGDMTYFHSAGGTKVSLIVAQATRRWSLT